MSPQGFSQALPWVTPLLCRRDDSVWVVGILLRSSPHLSVYCLSVFQQICFCCSPLPTSPSYICFFSWRQTGTQSSLNYRSLEVQSEHSVPTTTTTLLPTGYWLQDPPHISKSADAQIFYIEWHRICMQYMCILPHTFSIISREYLSHWIQCKQYEIAVILSVNGILTRKKCLHKFIIDALRTRVCVCFHLHSLKARIQNQQIQGVAM